ncbi:hypothetical protein [Robertkochia aurantiaca]|uniref:hypothetical protein n=1 Tax=Robertkochia aurantiaca TaxID=2873700 RepID=UPI001CCDE013|nr:hypothetical protein [Robertkochia sp. 3YJGBD-33]
MRPLLLLFTVLFSHSFVFASPPSCHLERNYEAHPGFFTVPELNFTMNQVRFYIYSDGSFDFEPLQLLTTNRRERARSYQSHLPVGYDRFGRISNVNGVLITYYRNGALRSLGDLFMEYKGKSGKLHKVNGHKVAWKKSARKQHKHGHIYVHRPMSHLNHKIRNVRLHQ